MSDINYTIDTDFPSGLNLEILFKQISDSSRLNKQVTSTRLDNIFTLHFDTSLNSSELTALETVISTHDPTPVEKTDILTLTQEYLKSVLLHNQRLSGSVSWDTGLTFDVSKSTYLIDSILYNTTGGTIVLNTAHASNSRVDVIYTDTNGLVGKVTGTAGNPPFKPALLSTQLELGEFNIAANSSEPYGLSAIKLYTDNNGTAGGEWTVTENTSGARIIQNSTVMPSNGTVCIEATAAVAEDEIVFTYPSLVSLSKVTHLEFKMLSKAEWIRKNIGIYFKTNGNVNGKAVDLRQDIFGWNSANIDTYQKVIIDINNFQLNSKYVDKLVFHVVTGPIGFYMDSVRFVKGLSGEKESKNVYGDPIYNYYAESLDVSSRTGTSFLSKLNINTNIIPPGDYKITWSYEWTITNSLETTSSFKARLLYDNDTTSLVMDQLQQQPTTTTDKVNIAAGSKVINVLSNTTHSFDLQYGSFVGGQTATIQNAKLEFNRVN
jgi:hypothetical protein